MTYNMPPWVGQPANPAEHYATGFQVGVRLGAQQAANAMQQQQMALERHRALMAQQQQEFENQLNVQALNWKASEMARKHQANAEFRARVAAGEDPSNVLMQLAPELGESAASVLHSRAALSQNREMMNYRNASLRSRNAIEREKIASREKTGIEMSPAERRAAALKRARERLSEVESLGDENAIAKERQYLADLEKFQSNERPDRARDAEIMLVRQQILQISKQLGDITLKSKWPDLEREKKALEDKLASFGNSSPVTEPSIVSDENTPGNPTTIKNRRLRWTPKGYVEVEAK